MYRHSPLMRSLLSQSQTPTDPRRSVGFFRSGGLASRPARLITQSTSDWLSIIVPTLSTVDASYLNRGFIKVNAKFWCKQLLCSCAYSKMQMVVGEKFSSAKNNSEAVLHRKIHSRWSNRKTLKGNQIIVLTVK